MQRWNFVLFTEHPQLLKFDTPTVTVNMMSFVKPNVSSDIRGSRSLSSGVWLIVSWLKSNMTIFYQSHKKFRQACLESNYYYY